MRKGGPSGWSGPNPGMSQLASNVRPKRMMTWMIRTTKPQNTRACMIPAGCSPAKNFFCPSP